MLAPSRHVSLNRRPFRALALLFATTAIAALSTAPAQAKNLYTLDKQADSSGPIVVDSSGTGYITWLRKPASASAPDINMFCRIPPNGKCTAPITLQLPAATNGTDDGTSQPYVVLAPDDEVWVVAPRYVLGDIVYWLSPNGGKSFNPPVDVTAPNDYANQTSVDGVLLEPNEPYLTENPPVAYFDIGSSNPGVGYSWLPTNLVGGGSQMTGFQFTNPGPGGVAGASIGQQPDGFPLEAYWNLSSPSQIFFYRQTTGNGMVAQPIQAWTSTSTLVSDGYLPQLASGPKGLFMAYEAYPDNNYNDTPSVLDIDQYNSTTNTFDSTATLVTDPQADTALFDGGTINENATTGAVAVVWPKFGSSGNEMRLWVSTNGTHFSYKGDVAKFGSSYSGSASLALNSKGGGFLTWQDGGGLKVADLTPTTHKKKSKHKK